MAEAIARHWIEQGLLGDADILVASAGIVAWPDSPPSDETLEALARLEIEHSGSSKPLTAEMVRKADLVLCMSASHHHAAQTLVEDDPDRAARIEMLDPEGDVEDPMGHGQAIYDELAAKLMELVPRRLKELLADENRAGSRSPRR